MESYRNIPRFFFSSRRRHTRCGRDWSSDMCSSDLHHLVFNKGSSSGIQPGMPVIDEGGVVGQIVRVTPFTSEAALLKIGRASCRESAQIPVVNGACTQTKQPSALLCENTSNSTVLF